MRSGILLLQTLSEYEIYVVLPERLFEAFFSGRIDPFADKDRSLAEFHNMRVR